MQHKNAMERIARLKSETDTMTDSIALNIESEKGEVQTRDSTLLPSVEAPWSDDSPCKQGSSLTSHVIATMKVIIPIKIILVILKIVLVLYFMDNIKHLLDIWYMPFLGILAACLANCVPIGGGIVYVPALTLLGSNMKLGVSFSVATMTVGNGILGYINWQRKNASLLVWEVIPFTVLPSSLGTIASLGMTSPPESILRTYFALFCFSLAVFVLYSVHKGGIASFLQEYFSTWKKNGNLGVNMRESSDRSARELSSAEGAVMVSVSFLAGLILVPNIAIGPSLTTFLALVLMGYSEQESMVTGIIVGGWVSVVPFLLHIFYYSDVPWDLWLMVLPGVTLGAWLAPKVQSYIGVDNALIVFGIFLLCTFVLFMT